MELLIALAIAIAVLAIIGLAFTCYKWVLGPIERAAKERDHRSKQFFLSDLFCLFVLAQLPAGMVHWAASDDPIAHCEIVCQILVGGLAVWLWWRCVGLLSCAGVTVVLHRCVVLVVVLPAGLLGGIAMAFIPIMALAALCDPSATAIGVGLLPAEVVLGGVLYGLGRLARRIVASAN
jgi:hypothetical protein